MGRLFFIGPRVAKRQEIRRPDVEVDMIMTFEELAVFTGMDINLQDQESFYPEVESVREAHVLVQKWRRYVCRTELSKGTRNDER